MEKLKILIVEDEMIIANDMRMILEELGYEVTAIAKNKQKAMLSLAEDEPDIVLLDINLGMGTEGIALAHVLREEFDLPFVFCTSHADEGIVGQAKETKPNGYLLKPFTNDDLYTAIEIAISNYSRKSGESAEKQEHIIKDSIFVKEGKLFVKISFKDIIYAAQDRNYVEIHTAERKYLVRSSLKDFLDLLPCGKFFQIHRSYIINLDHIEAINHTVVKIKESEIPLSKKYREDFLAKIKWLS